METGMFIAFIGCLIMAFSAFLVYMCLKTKTRARIMVIVLTIIVDIVLLLYLYMKYL